MMNKLGSKRCRSPAYVGLLDCPRLVPRLFEFLSLDSPNNNIHNIRVCRIMVTQQVVSSQELAAMDVAEKVRQCSNRQCWLSLLDVWS
jgi:hypothetical protein